MEIKICCAWWGLYDLGMERMLRKIKESGFDGVETGIPEDPGERELLRDLADGLGLIVVAHQYIEGHQSFDEYFSLYSRAMETAAEFQPVLINSHTGKDYWTYEQNGLLIEEGDKIAGDHGVTVAHETHRGRFLFSTFVAAEYFKRYPGLKINFDLSHWCCVSESLLDDQPSIVDEAIRRAEHVHARVGHAQGAQVTDPRDPQWKHEVDVFTGWWEKIIGARAAEGRDMFTITPEFGPIPYTMKKPFTNEPLNDFFELNVYMKDYLRRVLANAAT